MSGPVASSMPRTRSTFSWRLGFAHELGIGLSASISVLIVLLGGAFPLPAWLVLLAPILSSALVVRGLEAPRFSGTALALAGIGLGVSQVVTKGTEVLVYGGGIALLGILAGRLITRRTLAHDIQTIILALVLVMAGSVLNPGLSYGILFVGFGITVIWALTTRQLLSGADASAEEQGHAAHAVSSAVRERTDVVTPSFFAVTGGVAILVLVATSVVFVAFPRVGLGSLSIFSNQKAGFPTSVSLNGGAINGGGTAVTARAFFVPKKAFLDGLYLRGMVFDEVSTRGASRLAEPVKLDGVALRLARGPEDFLRYSVMMEPVSADIVMALGAVEKSRSQKGGKSNPNLRAMSPSWNSRGELTVREKLRKPVRYSLSGFVSAPGYIPEVTKKTMWRRRRQMKALGKELPPFDEKAPPQAMDGKLQRELAQRLAPHLIALPEDLPPELVELADTFGGPNSDIQEAATNIRQFLMNEFRYTLSQPNGYKANPLVAFLLEDRRGHCEYFASAFALLLRMQGIPARVVGGYQGGEYDGVDDVVIFRERNAHAWVEWLHPDFGWIVDDATPMATAERAYLTGFAALVDRLQRMWGDSVVDYSLGSQLQAAQEVRSKSKELLDRLSGSPLKVVGGAAGAVAFLFLLVRWRRRGRKETLVVDPLAAAIEAGAAAVFGHGVPASWTLREAVAAVDQSHPSTPRLQEALGAHERAEYGGRPLLSEQKEALVDGLKSDAKAAVALAVERSNA